MSKRIIKGPQSREKLLPLLEGYLFGIGEVCHNLFGAAGEEAMYLAIGSFFLRYLKDELRVSIDEQDPWERFCRLKELFTVHGFYTHLELEKRSDGVYWMLEKGQYAGQIWENQKSWERGSAPCPLWSLVLASLSEIGYAITLDRVNYVEEAHGFECVFHFEKIEKPAEDLLALTRRKLLASMITFCCVCKKARRPDGNWVSPEEYLSSEHDTMVSHTYCPECYAKARSELDRDMP